MICFIFDYFAPNVMCDKKIKWEERREEKAKERKKTKAKKGGGEACKSITFSNSS